MKIAILCPTCDAAAEQFFVDLLPQNDCLYELECPVGHRFAANVLYHQFQKLFEVGVNALADDYYREAVGAFIASYERFIELFIRIVMKSNGTSDAELASGWKKIARQSERQLGAFITLFIQEFSSQPPILGNAQTELRNKLVHQGYFPTRSECVGFGDDVLGSIRQGIDLLYKSEKHRPELTRSINDQVDFSKAQMQVYAYPLIGTNRPPDADSKTLEQMVAYVLFLRKELSYKNVTGRGDR